MIRLLSLNTQSRNFISVACGSGNPLLLLEFSHVGTVLMRGVLAVSLGYDNQHSSAFSFNGHLFLSGTGAPSCGIARSWLLRWVSVQF